MDFTVRTDHAYLGDATPFRRYVVVSIKVPDQAVASPRSAVNTAIVLDRSGSMGGEKLDLARKAVAEALNLLNDRDRFSLLVYDDEVDTLVESTTASKDSKSRALELLKTVDARGRTDLARGWLLGCEQVSMQSNGNSVDRCMLLTDGIANVGITDPVELAFHAEQLSSRGLETSTFGLGADFDEQLLQLLADAGGGHFYFIEQAVQISDFLIGELREVLDIQARNVALRVTPPQGVKARLLSQVKAIEENGELRVNLGDLVSRQRLNVVFEFSFDDDFTRSTATARFRLTAGRPSEKPLPSRLIRWKRMRSGAGKTGVPDHEVLENAARMLVSKGKQEALEMNRSGEFQAAGVHLRALAEQLAGLAQGDRRVLEIKSELEKEFSAYERSMSSIVRKRRFFALSTMSRMRDASGKAQRR